MNTESILYAIVQLLQLPKYKEGVRFDPSVEIKLLLHTVYIYRAVYDRGIWLMDGKGDYWQLEATDHNADKVGEAILTRLKYLSSERRVLSKA
jgi:hypothetical protein